MAAKTGRFEWPAKAVDWTNSVFLDRVRRGG
ncbi:hypothetical protein X734_10030 [Mesorhizobium sp. L2C084A000]|nr:hypothetical protein X734_10030 [Mesorhizobium sp. L2C084A000]